MARVRVPFPCVRCLYLAGVGTHAIVDGVLARCKASEQALANVLLRSIERGMLVMTDRHFRSLKWWLALKQRGAHVLARLAAGYFTQPSQRLCDGSYLVTTHPKGQPPLTDAASSSIASIPCWPRTWPACPPRVPPGPPTLVLCIDWSRPCLIPFNTPLSS